MDIKRPNGKKTKKNYSNTSDVCVVLNVDKNRCYIDFCRVPKHEREMILVK